MVIAKMCQAKIMQNRYAATRVVLISLTLLVLSSLAYAETIDGPANVRLTPKGKVIFSLNNNVPVNVVLSQGEWRLIRVNIAFDKGSLSEEGKIRKGTVLYDEGGNKIGESLDEVEVKTKSEKNENYAALLEGYTYRENIVADSAGQNLKSKTEQGSLIAFSTDGNYVLNLATQQYKTIASGKNVTTPVLSPTKDNIAYVFIKERVLKIENMKTGEIKKIPLNCNGDWVSYAWSPDGDKIAVFCHKMASDIVQFVIFDVKVGTIISSFQGVSFSWSNDGKSFLLLDEFDSMLKTQKLYSVALGPDTRKVIYEFNGFYVSNIAWSPDQINVAFQGNKNQGEETGVFVLELKTKRYHQVTSNIFSGQFLRWMKDGKRLIWNFCQSLQCDLTIEDTVKKKTLAKYGNAKFVDISRNEDRIYYSKRNGVFVNNIPPDEELQLFGNPIITHDNVTKRINEKMRGFETYDAGKRSKIADWLVDILNPPVGETFPVQDEGPIKLLGAAALFEKEKEIKQTLISCLEGVLRYGAAEKAVPYLVEMLFDQYLPSDIRAHCARSLGWSKGYSTAQYTVKYARDPNKEIRMAVAWALFAQQGKKDSEKILPLLMTAIQEENEPEAIQYLAWTLRNIQNKAAVPALKLALRKGVQRSDKSIVYIIEALASLDSGIVREILQQGTPMEITALGEELSSHKEIDASLKSIVRNKLESPVVRRTALKAMRMEGQKWPYKLKRVLEDKDFLNYLKQAVDDLQEDAIIKNEAQVVLNIFKYM